MKKPTLTFRPAKDNHWMLDSLEKLANKENRSLNNYIETVLLNHLKENKIK